MGFLSDVVADVRRDLERRPLDESRLMARAMSMPPARDFAGALRAGSPGIIAEVKRSSPSAGLIADVDPGELAAAYEAGGASAISVLTEGRHFGGSLADLWASRMRTSLPVLRKDFLVHPAQLIEARAAGADAVLLIAACLSAHELAALLGTSKDLGMGTLVETHSNGDLDMALASGAEVVGVNARDLETLEVELARALEQLSRIPLDRIAVMESAIAERAQVVAAVEAGASAILVGEALMRAPDPVAKLQELLGGSSRELFQPSHSGRTGRSEPNGKDVT
jgi:indole-3-glycerol phosphate synthase